MNDVQFRRDIPGRTPLEIAATRDLRAGEGDAIPLLTQYFRIALRWKWVILGSILAAFLAGLVITLLMTPQYTATSTIEISRESNKIVEIEGVERESGSADLEFYQTQYGLLRSRSLAERVANELGLTEDPAFFEMFGVDTDEGVFADDNRRLTAAGREERQRKAGEILLQNLEVAPVRLSRLVDISFTSPSPELSARVTNAWAAHFIETNLERRYEATSYARKFLEDRLAQLRARLEDSERMLVAYASNQRIINLPAPTIGGQAVGGERSLVAEDLAALNAELAEATADRVRAQSRWRPNQDAAGASPEALSNVAIASIREKRAEVASEYAQMMAQFEPEYPPAQALASQLAQLDRSIAREESRVAASLERNYREAAARENALSQRVETLKTGMLDLRRRSIQYDIYQREVDTNRQLYDGLLQRYKEIEIAGGVGTNNVSIVDAADVPNEPSKPRLFVNLLLSLLLGTAIGALLAFALEQIDEAIVDPIEVERLLNVPLLGTIPKTVDLSPAEAMLDRKSELVDAYLSVQTNLEFSTGHGVPRSLSVTSTRPAEGKSTTAFALATSLARAKRKVVLVDGDMRSPSVHNLAGFANERGLSNFLSGNDNLAELIQPVTQFGFSAVAAGPSPPNAAELLTGDRLPLLIETLLKSFDHVVINSPPVMGLADAPLLASRVEGTVFAVESHGIRASLVRVALGRLVSANARVIGTVLTKFEAKRAHFGYGYDYGYGYGEKKREAARAS